MRSCAVRLQGCQLKGTCLAHAPSVESGRGYKSPDWWAAYACAHCHDVLDGRKPSGMTREEKAEAWFSAVFETQFILHEEGYLKET